MITRISSVIRPEGSDLVFDHPYNAESVAIASRIDGLIGRTQNVCSGSLLARCILAAGTSTAIVLPLELNATS